MPRERAVVKLSIWVLSILSAAAVVAFAMRDEAWSCRATLSMPEVISDAPNSLQYRGGGSAAAGTFLEANRLNLGAATMALPIQEIDIFGAGDYRFKYIGNVNRVRIRVEGREAYSGPPIDTLAAGPGWLGVVAEGEGPITVVAEDRCSIRTQLRSWFGRG
jgi:hypothetical protein